MEQTLTTSLLDNKLALKGLFGTATDFYTKDITLMGYPACICMFEGLSSIERLWIMMLDVLSKPDVQPETPEELFDYILKQTAIPLESKSVVCVEDARAQLTAGTSVILIDGVARGLGSFYTEHAVPLGAGAKRGRECPWLAGRLYRTASCEHQLDAASDTQR